MMTRGATRAFLVCSFLVAAVVTWIVPTAPAARAQGPSVDLMLLSQTPWTAPDDPATARIESELRVAVVAANRGQARLGELALSVVFGPPYLSRLEFASSIAVGPGIEASTVTTPIEGRLEPGTARTFTVRVDVAAVAAVSQDDSRVYPVLVRLTSGTVVVAELSTAAIHVVREPEAPLWLSWWIQLTAPIAFDPQGRLIEPGLEAAVTDDGELGAQTEAIAGVTDARGATAPIDLVVEPYLVDQLERMAAGYLRADGTEVAAGEGPSGAAAALLERLSAAATTPDIQISGGPFSGPSIPAMLASGLRSELTHQDEAGTDALRRALGASPTSTVARPPGGLLDGEALAHLTSAGAVAILADADEVDRPPVGELEFTPLPTAPVTTAAGATTLVLPDPSTQRLFDRGDLLGDPVRAAQIVLANLAVVWKEQPIPFPQPDGSPTVRGVAIAPPSDLPPAMWEPLLQRIAGAPFLLPTHAQRFIEEVTGPSTPAVLRAPEAAVFTAPYAAETLRLRRDTDAYASMLVEESSVPDALRTDLLYATSRRFLVPNEPSGRTWLDAVADVTGPAFAGVTPSVPQVFTFTSRDGTIPLRMGDPGPFPLRVTVVLRSSKFEFPEGDRQEVVLERPDQIVSFDVVAKAAGRNPITVVVIAPSGEVIHEDTITVASTVLNRIALLVTIVAGAGLVALYGRRQLRRRRAAS